MNPRARIDCLQASESEAGLILHDTGRGQSHTLHPLTAFVWKNADGRTSVSELVTLGREQLGPLGIEVTEDLIWTALDSLGDAGLLQGPQTPRAGTQRIGRRDLIRRVAASAAAATAIGTVPARANAAPVSQEEAQKLLGQEKESLQKAATRSKEENQKFQAESAAKRQQQHAENEAKRNAAEDSRKTAAEQSSKAMPAGDLLELRPAWENIGGAFQGAAVLRSGRLCLLSGLVRMIGPTQDPVLLMLPDDCRPGASLVFGGVGISAADLGLESPEKKKEKEGTGEPKKEEEQLPAGSGAPTLSILVSSDGAVALVGQPEDDVVINLSGIVFGRIRAEHVPGQGNGGSAQEQARKHAEDSRKQQREEARKHQEEARKRLHELRQQQEQAHKQQREQVQKVRHRQEQAQKQQEQARKQHVEARRKQQEQAQKAEQAAEAKSKQAQEQKTKAKK